MVHNLFNIPKIKFNFDLQCQRSVKKNKERTTTGCTYGNSAREFDLGPVSRSKHDRKNKYRIPILISMSVKAALLGTSQESHNLGCRDRSSTTRATLEATSRGIALESCPLRCSLYCETQHHKMTPSLVITSIWLAPVFILGAITSHHIISHHTHTHRTHAR